MDREPFGQHVLKLLLSGVGRMDSHGDDDWIGGWDLLLDRSDFESQFVVLLQVFFSMRIGFGSEGYCVNEMIQWIQWIQMILIDSMDSMDSNDVWVNRI